MLGKRHKEEGSNRAGQTYEAGVFCHSDYLNRVLWVGAELEFMADGILIGPVFLRHRFVNNGDVLTVLGILLVDGTAAKQCDSHRVKVLGGNRVVGNGILGLSRGGLVAIDFDQVKIAVVTHGHGIRNAGGFDTGDGPHSIEKVLVEPPALRIAVTDLGGIHAEIENVARIEAEGGLLRLAEATHEKASDDEQHERARDLNNNQHVTEGMAARNYTATTLVQNGA